MHPHSARFRERVKLKRAELRALFCDLDLGQSWEDAWTIEQALRFLAVAVFDGDHDAVEQWMAPPGVGKIDGEYTDADKWMGDILEEIAAHDHDNFDEVQDMRAVLQH